MAEQTPRYWVGQPQTVINDLGTQYDAGIEERKPYTTGRTAQSAERKYQRWLHKSQRPESAYDYVIWDRTAGRYLDRAEPAY